MFSNKDEKQAIMNNANTTNQIAKGTYLEGNVESYGNMRIEGKVKGNITSKSKVILDASSHVEGNIMAQNAEISGEVNGKIEVSEVLALKASANVKGEIVTNKLIVESGATFNGGCKMGVSIKDIKIGGANASEGIKQGAKAS